MHNEILSEREVASWLGGSSTTLFRLRRDSIGPNLMKPPAQNLIVK
jgi:hypothetical protein